MCSMSENILLFISRTKMDFLFGPLFLAASHLDTFTLICTSFNFMGGHFPGLLNIAII